MLLRLMTTYKTSFDLIVSCEAHWALVVVSVLEGCSQPFFALQVKVKVKVR